MASSSSTPAGGYTRLTPPSRASGPENVLIIGGGATGLVALRNLVEERGRDSHGSYPLFSPTLVERRADVGGVWYWSDETYSLERALGATTTQGLSPVYDPKGKPHWPSPAYLNLRGNVLPEFLEFSGKKMRPPANGETFPSMQETHQYLREFAEPYQDYIVCGIEILQVRELAKDQGWEVTIKDWNTPLPDQEGVSYTPRVLIRRYDRVVIAAGWYDSPYYPDTPGLNDARKAGLVHHCKHYRDSLDYRGKKVVVVGNNNSANEVAAHLAPFNTKDRPVYRSAKTAPVDKCPSLPDERIRDVGMIVDYQINQGGKLDLTLKDGEKIEAVDVVILGTGYGQRYPWVQVLTDEARANGTSETQSISPDELKGTRVPNMYNHALFAKSPRLTLAFVGLVISTMPFSFNDLISAWITAVWAGKITSIPLSLPARLAPEVARLDHMLSVRRKNNPAIDPNDPATYAGYHLLGGSLAEGPPSELHFAADLFTELEKVDPQRVQLWDWRWDQAREERQTGMYRRKKEWLEQNRERIRGDPFDLLGANRERYGWLVDELVDPEYRRRKEAHESAHKANL